jgi:hypothetical protein
MECQGLLFCTSAEALRASCLKLSFSNSPFQNANHRDTTFWRHFAHKRENLISLGAAVVSGKLKPNRRNIAVFFR